MPTKRVISTLFAFLMLLQMLPIEQIGRMLYQNQWTEELPHGTDDSSGKDMFAQPVCHEVTGGQPYLVVTEPAPAYFTFTERLPADIGTQIISPPPDL